MIVLGMVLSAYAAETDPQTYLLAQPAALVALDSTGTPFVEPGTPTDWGVAASRVLSPDFTPKPGGAFEVSAAGLGLTRRLSYSTYSEHLAWRALSRSALSLATAAGDEEDVRTAVGLKVGVLHEADELLDKHYIDAVDKARADCDAQAAEATAAGEDFDSFACRAKAFEKGFAEAPPPPWNSHGLVLAGAYVGNFKEGQLTKFGGDEVSVWLSGALGVKEWGQAGIAFAWTQSLDEGWTRLAPTVRLRGALPGARIALEAGYALTVNPSEAPTHLWNVSLGGDVRLEQGAWVYADVGVQIDPQLDLVTLTQSANVQWGRASSARFGGS